MLEIQHGLMLRANMRPTWSHVGLQKDRFGASHGPPRPFQDGGQLGRLLAAKTPSKMEANLGSQKSIFEAQVGLHFGGGAWRALGAIGYFFGALVGPPSQTPAAGKKPILVKI